MNCPLVPDCPVPAKRKRRAESLLQITSTLGEKLDFTQILLLEFKSERIVRAFFSCVKVPGPLSF